jgi:hypothetical protein
LTEKFNLTQEVMKSVEHMLKVRMSKKDMYLQLQKEGGINRKLATRAMNLLLRKYQNRLEGLPSFKKEKKKK